jgi:cell division protein FtsZ
VLQAARESDAATLGVAAIPFAFEGRQRRERADAAIVDLLAAADTLVVMHNDRLVEATGKTAVAESFREADRILGEALDSIWGLLVWPGYLNLGFADLRRIMRRGGGICTLGYGWGSGRARVEKALAELLEGPLLDHGRALAEAKGVLVSIMGGADLTIQEVGEIVNAIRAKAPEKAEIEVGTVVDEQVRGKLRVTAIASEAWASADEVKPAVEVEPKPPDGDVEAGRRPEAAPAAEPGKKPRVTQARLNLEAAGRGRFKDMEPTVLDGEDLDIPTFIRRGLRL